MGITLSDLDAYEKQWGLHHTIKVPESCYPLTFGK